MAKQREWKENKNIIYKNRSVPFDIDQFQSDSTEKETFFYILVYKI